MSADKTQRTRVAYQLVLGLLLITASADTLGDELYWCNEDNGLLNDCLVGDCFSEHTGFRVSGWLQQGFTWNPDRPVDRFNGPVTQNDRANE